MTNKQPYIFTIHLHTSSIKGPLMGFGERYTKKDVDAFFECVPIENNKFPAKYCADMITGKLKEDQ